MVVSGPTRVTSISTAPVRFCVPAKTSSPAALSRGSDSPVMLASFSVVWPATTRPSAGTVSPGRTRMRSPSDSAWAATSSSRPSLPMRRAVAGVRRMRLSIARCAPAAVRSSIARETSMKNATTPAVRKSPLDIAASTAMATSSSTCVWPARRPRMAPQMMGSASTIAPAAAVRSLTSGLVANRWSPR